VTTSAPALDATPQPGQITTQAAAVPAKQPPRPPTIAPPAPKTTAPFAPAKPTGPNTTASPPVVDRGEPKAPGPVKIEVSAPTPEVISAPKVEKAGISPTARRALSDTLPSGISVASLKVEAAPPPPVEPPKQPTAQPPLAAKTAPAVPEAIKRPSQTAIPAAPVGPPKPAPAPVSVGRAALTALKPETPQTQAKVAPPRLEPAPVSGPPRVGAVVLETIEALADLPTDVHKTLVRAAIVEEVSPGETRDNVGVILVLAGDVSVSAAGAEVPGQTFRAPAFISSRGTLARGLSLRFAAGPSGATVARWTTDFFEETLKACSWVIDDCRAIADKLQASLGLTLGPFAHVDASVRDELVKRLDLRVLEPGDVITEENGPMPGLLIVTAGVLDLLEGEALRQVGESRAGELLFVDSLWAGAPAPLTSRAAASGALLLVGDRKAALDLAGEFAAVEQILSR